MSSLTWTYFALLMAAVASLGSVALSLNLQLAACPLCYYQRTFAFATLAILAVGLLYQMNTHVCLASLALPLALAGGAIAGFHVSLEWRGKMECPVGVTRLLSAPQESALAFTLMVLPLLAASLQDTQPGAGIAAVVLAVVLAGLLAVACVATVAMPPPPKLEMYQSPPKGCRPLPPPNE
jgi:disulfide bond formation protein DsbB